MWTQLLLTGGFASLAEELNFVTTLIIQCIRNSMTSKQECPVCRKSANEGQIRPMVSLEEVVESWKAARYVTDDYHPSDLAAKLRLQGTSSSICHSQRRLWRFNARGESERRGRAIYSQQEEKTWPEGW